MICKPVKTRSSKKNMVNYQLGKIYKIVSNESLAVYYGSTCQTLNNRISEHRKHYRQFLKGKMNYITSFEIIKYSSNQIVLVELYPCNSKEELHARERHFIESNECTNKNIPGRTYEEYYKDNKEIIAIRGANYYKDNADYIKTRVNNYRSANLETIKAKKGINHNCECGGTYQNGHKARHFKSKKHTDFKKMEIEEICQIFDLTLEEYNEYGPQN